MGFLHVDQAGPELLTSGDPPASASQSVGITGVSHNAQPLGYCFKLSIHIAVFSRGDRKSELLGKGVGSTNLLWLGREEPH